MEPFSVAIGAGFALGLKDLAQGMVAATINLGRNEAQKLAVDIETGLSKFLLRNYERASKSKTLLNKYEPANTKDIYVESDFRKEKDTFGELQIFSRLQDKRMLAVILGSAGSGKSMFMKRNFMRMAENCEGRIPVLIDLRRLNDGKQDGSIYKLMFESIQDLIPKFSDFQLDYALRSGKFCLFLDGFDEIDFERYQAVEKEILSLSYKYSKTSLVVSSRVDNRFLSWTEFSVFSIEPLDQDKAISLIKRAPFSDEIKGKLALEVEKRLFASHRTFLSNPLLCSMMLLSYAEYPEVPPKMHLFYAQAFDVLFQRHDMMKEQFRRKLKTNLAIDDFRRLFSVICTITYLDRKYEFRPDEMLKYIESSLALSGCAEANAAVLDDLVNAICVLVRDGEFISFVHRSFQEYFCAVFLSENPDERCAQIIKAIAARHLGGEVIGLLFGINAAVLEKQYLHRAVTDAAEDTSLAQSAKKSDDIFRMFYHALMIDYESGSERRSTISFLIGRVDQANPKHSPVLLILERFYEGILFKDDPIELDWEFDWVSHAERKGYTAPLSGSSLSIKSDSISCEFIVSSPLREHLESRSRLILAAKTYLDEKAGRVNDILGAHLLVERS